jgi:hypothetical protein
MQATTALDESICSASSPFLESGEEIPPGEKQAPCQASRGKEDTDNATVVSVGQKDGPGLPHFFTPGTV